MLTGHWERVVVVKRAMKKKKKNHFTSRLEETGTALYGAGIGTLWRVDQKNLECFEMCWRRMEKVNWIDRVRDRRISRRMAKCIGQVLCRNRLLKHFVEGKIQGMIQVTGRWRGRRRQLGYNIKETRGYWKFICGVETHWPLRPRHPYVFLFMI